MVYLDGGEYWKMSLVVVLTRGGGGSMGSWPLPGNTVDRAVMPGNRLGPPNVMPR